MQRQIFLVLLCSTIALWGQDKVANGMRPHGDGKTLAFKAELQFGSDEEDENYLWPLSNTDIAVDDKGNVFVANTKDNKIAMFDGTGAFVKNVTIEGQGPGEIQALISFQILADGRGVVLEGKPGIIPSFSYFDKDMKFVKKVSHQGGFFPVFALLSPDGNIFGARVLSLDMASNSMLTRFGLLAMEPEAFVAELSQYSQKTNFAQFEDPAVLSSFIGDMLKGQYSQTGHYAFDSKGHVFTAVSKQYEITRWSPDAKVKEMVITREYKPMPLSDDEILAAADAASEEFRGTPFESMINDQFLKHVAARADLPPVKSPIAGLLCLPEGQLLVIRLKNALTGSQQADVFDEKGAFIAQVSKENWAFVSPTGQQRMVFRNQRAYTLETDNNGDNRVVRYSYSWETAP